MDSTPAKSPENMTSTELKAHLAGEKSPDTLAKSSKPPAAKSAKVKAKRQPSKLNQSKAQKAKASKAKPAAKSKARKPAKASKTPKTKAARKPAKVRLIAAHLVANKGKAHLSTALAKLFKCRPVEIHRAVAILERQGATVEATRSGPTQKPGRRAFLYAVTKGPAPKPAKASKAKRK